MLRNIKVLFKNLMVLSSHSIKDLEYKQKASIYDNVFYELSSREKWPTLNVLNCEETLDLLLRSTKSFCRFGDGEIELIKGRSIPFQRYNKRLADYLVHILKNNMNDLYVGINYHYFNSTIDLNDASREFYVENVSRLRATLLDHCCKDRIYIAAGFNQVYMTYDNFEFDSYYLKLKELFRDKSIVVFAGKTVFENIDFDLFELAKHKEIITCKSKNSFDDFDEILKTAMKIRARDTTFAFILGPCSKPLVYELTKQQRMAWDIGHMCKDYDWYMKKKENSRNNIKCFFRPD